MTDLKDRYEGVKHTQHQGQFTVLMISMTIFTYNVKKKERSISESMIILTNYVARTATEKITVCAVANREFSLHKHWVWKKQLNVRVLSSCQSVCGSLLQKPFSVLHGTAAIMQALKATYRPGIAAIKLGIPLNHLHESAVSNPQKRKGLHRLQGRKKYNGPLPVPLL